MRDRVTEFRDGARLPREDRVVVRRATALDLGLLRDELRRIAGSPRLDARTAERARMRALSAVGRRSAPGCGRSRPPHGSLRR